MNQGYQIYTDASDIAMGGALQQDGAPIAFFSKKLDSAQRNYMIYEKEAFALVSAVKQWHHLIHNGKPITAYCDNRGVACLLRQTFSVARQARWAAFLQQYNLSIEFIPARTTSSPTPSHNSMKRRKPKTVMTSTSSTV